MLLKVLYLDYLPAQTRLARFRPGSDIIYRHSTTLSMDRYRNLVQDLSPHPSSFLYLGNAESFFKRTAQTVWIYINIAEKYKTTVRHRLEKKVY